MHHSHIILYSLRESEYIKDDMLTLSLMGGGDCASCLENELQQCIKESLILEQGQKPTKGWIW